MLQGNATFLIFSWKFTNYTLFIFYSANSTIQHIVIKGCFTYNNRYRQVKSQHIVMCMCCLYQRHHATQSYYLDTEPTSPYPILIMSSLTRPGFKAVGSGFEPTMFGFPDLYCLSWKSLNSLIFTIRWQLVDRKPEPTLLSTQRIFSLPHHIGMAWQELAFDSCAKLYTAVEI